MLIFILGLTIGFSAGVVFYNWWITPDVDKLRKHVAHLEEQKVRLATQVMKNANMKVKD